MKTCGSSTSGPLSCEAGDVLVHMVSLDAKAADDFISSANKLTGVSVVLTDPVIAQVCTQTLSSCRSCRYAAFYEGDEQGLRGHTRP